MTRKQLESRKAKAARFARDVLEDPDRAAGIEAESFEDYAQRRRFQIRNPKGVNPVAIPTRRDLLNRIKELESDNEDLQSRIDEIGDIVGSDDSEEEEEDAGRD